MFSGVLIWFSTRIGLKSIYQEYISSVYRVIYILALVINLIFIVSLSYFLYYLSQKNILLEKIVRIIWISLIYNLILWGILTIIPFTYVNINILLDFIF